MNRKIAIRLVLGLIAIAGLFYGFGAIKEFAKDPDTADVDTTGVIVALEQTKLGSQVVVFSPNGEKRTIPGTDDTIVDRDFSWSPDGRHIYFSSNRELKGLKDDRGAFNIFRWRYGADQPEQFTKQRRSMSAPVFDPNPKFAASGLVLAGGNVLDFFPREKTSQQVMPPVMDERGTTGEGGGSSGSMENVYSQLGSSFRQAVWTPDHKAMYAVMRRDDGEVLIYHDFQPTAEGRMQAPQGILAGSRVQIATSVTGKMLVTQSDAAAVYAELERLPPDWVKDGKVFPNIGGQRLTHMLWFVDIEPTTGKPKLLPMVPPTANPNDPKAIIPVFMDPVISPDGTMAAVVIASRPTPNQTVPFGLILMPMAQDGAMKGKPLVQGVIGTPSFTPDGKAILFTRLEGGKQGIYKVNVDGSSLTKISDAANFSNPVMSPQQKVATAKK